MRNLILAGVIAVLAMAVAATGASADGQGSPDECLDGVSEPGDSYTAPDGFTVDGICIKSGQLHTGELNIGDDWGCYIIGGLGTQTVTVSKESDGPDCQDVSHIDIILTICTDQCDPPGCDPEPCDPPTDPCELDPGSCEEITIVCVNGVFVEAPADQATSDCDPIRICVDGESMTVTEFVAAQTEGAEVGSCTPSEDPPPEDPTPEPAPVEQIEEVAAVQEVAPVEEVAALPSAGYGDSSETSILWILTFGALLVGFGGSTVVAVRHRK